MSVIQNVYTTNSTGSDGAHTDVYRDGYGQYRDVATNEVRHVPGS